ncbi:hypothetical protein [Acidithiobacillus ferridurans]|uniref:Uncharacterized protein n=2 Tax=Acidithiobacillus ferridurans TaxID=1232575 RepID=A0A8X8KBK6_ACIFI|nr:hypothetical protein [Acidithiobacillus ferridurans]MBU2714572.1 hypothetical protein [Acidithiobacillus ferridurans]MBU2724806.1 hypothetical protein [Acidithiobacillus ferridurans]MBU2725840.1 hypothetical protein [Acidithiobacillus ferridurans]
MEESTRKSPRRRAVQPAKPVAAAPAPEPVPAQPVATVKKYVRRTPEQLIAELEQKKAELSARLQEKIDALDERRRKLEERPALRKERIEQQKRFERTIRAIAPDWDYAQMVGAIEMSLGANADMDELRSKGEVLLDKHGKPRRGGRSRKG